MSTFPAEHVRAHVEAIATGWATPADWRRSPDRCYRPSNVLADLTRDLIKAKGQLITALAEGRVAEARAKAIATALPGTAGAHRRFVKDLDKTIVNVAILPISRGTANAILDAADKLRSREAIAGVADIEAVLGGLEKGDAPTHDQLAGLVSIHAARRANGLATGGQWLSDGGVALCKALVEKWPHVPTGVIEAQVYGVSLNPALVGVSTHNWSPESGDEAARVLLAEFDRVVSTIRSRSDFSPLDDLVEWTETHHRSPPFWLRECLDGFEPDRSLREDFNRAVCEKIATGMARGRDLPQPQLGHSASSRSAGSGAGGIGGRG